MKKISKRIIIMVSSVLICVIAGVTIFTIIKNGNSGGKIDNESTRLILSSSEVDGVFNPFYSSSGPDSTIVGMTQIGMLGADKDGKLAYGNNEACVVLDYSEVITGHGDNERTTYTFVLKNNVKFSNGSPLTMKDVLFNLYVYLDQAYYGSATLYSTDIVGLKEYRTQTSNEIEQDRFDENFASLADERVQKLSDIAFEVKEENKRSLTVAEFKSELQRISNEFGSDYKTVVEDFDLACKHFQEELETDFINNMNSYDSIKFQNKNTGQEISLTNDVEAFLYAEGFIKWDDKNYVFDYSFGVDSKNWTKEKAIKTVYDTKIPNEIDEVINYWNTATTLRTYFATLEKEAYFNSITREYKNISGIKFINRTAPVDVKGKTYATPTYAEDGSVNNDTNEVLEITINGVDPKAIWNFAFSVAPMYYYSSPEEIALFDYEEHFGVTYSSQSFQDEVIRNVDKIGVPVGAGPYKASTKSGTSTNVSSGSFKENNVIYFERNEHFVMGKPKIKYINYQVIPQNQLMASLFGGQVHYVEPAAKNEIIRDLENRKNQGFDYYPVMTNGYGYIGLNPSKVKYLEVRQAIMHAIDITKCLDYYPGYASAIYRPMSKASWAYPNGLTEQYYKFDQTGKTSEDLVIAAGFTKGSDGVYQLNGEKLEFEFTIAGDSVDHPTYAAMKEASEILNKRGFKITVRPDSNALKKLNNGDLAVWAAAWSSTIDPDMYQVYHINSKAGSTKNWGYDSIKRDKIFYKREYALAMELSELIEAGRETNVQSERQDIYKEALDVIMELAIELPTYQRSDLFAFNNKIIDQTTMTAKDDLTPLNGPLSRIWELSLNETK